MLTCRHCKHPVEALVQALAPSPLKRRLVSQATTHEGWCRCAPKPCSECGTATEPTPSNHRERLCVSCALPRRRVVPQAGVSVAVMR